jgi:hypothetical protein
MVKIVKLFPVYLSSEKFTPAEIRELILNMSNFVMLSGSDEV